MMHQTTRKVYISGPMTGHDDFNFPAFHEAAERFREAGWDVANPAENFDGRTDLPRELYVAADMAMLTDCDAIAMLPDWEDSPGAKLEYLVAHELGCAVLDAVTLEPLVGDLIPQVDLYCPVLRLHAPGESILDEAKRITDGVRSAEYGEPDDDFAKAALMWTGILAGKLRDDAVIAPMDIPLCMVAIKLARQSHCHKRDNLVDIAGYARTAAIVAGDE